MTRLRDQTLLVRVDASRTIGHGHAMRCVALAQEWRHRGGHVLFAMNQSTPSFDAVLAEGHFEQRAIGFGGDELAGLAREVRPAWIVMDLGASVGAHLDAELHAPTLVVDDLGGSFDVSPTLLLNQNAHGPFTRYAGLEDAGCLLGLDYVMLRDDFVFTPTRRSTDPARSHVLVVMGGTDPLGLIPDLVPAICSAVDATVHVMTANPDTAESLRSAGHRGLLVHTDPTEFAPLMETVDVAVTSGGSTVWELAYRGVPSVVGSVSVFEDLGLEGLVAVDLFRTLGRFRDHTPDWVAARVKEACEDRAWQATAAERGRALVDGRGRERVVDALVERTVAT